MGWGRTESNCDFDQIGVVLRGGPGAAGASRYSMGQQPTTTFASGSNPNVSLTSRDPSAAKASCEQNDGVRIDASQDLTAFRIARLTFMVFQACGFEEIQYLSERSAGEHMEGGLGSGQQKALQTRKSQCHVPEPVGRQDRNLRNGLGKHASHF